MHSDVGIKSYFLRLNSTKKLSGWLSTLRRMSCNTLKVSGIFFHNASVHTVKGGTQCAKLYNTCCLTTACLPSYTIACVKLDFY